TLVCVRTEGREMAYFVRPDAQTVQLTNLPYALPILPLRTTLAYPFFVLPLTVGIPRSVRLIEEAVRSERLIGLVAVPDATVEEPGPGQVYETGTLAMIQQVTRTPANILQVIVQGIERFRIARWVQGTPYLRASITLAPDIVEVDGELETLRRRVCALAQEVVALSPQIPRELWGFLGQVRDPRYLTYLVATTLQVEVTQGQQRLEANTVQDKFRLLITHLTPTKDMLGLRQEIQTEAREAMDKAQREYYLRQQLTAIQKELGEADTSRAVVEDYRQKIAAAKLPEEARHEALRELARLQSLPSQAPEYGIIETYLEWLIALPWHALSTDHVDIEHARTVLDEDHYDLREVKDRILEYLAVRKLHAERMLLSEPGTKPIGYEA